MGVLSLHGLSQTDKDLWQASLRLHSTFSDEKFNMVNLKSTHNQIKAGNIYIEQL